MILLASRRRAAGLGCLLSKRSHATIVTLINIDHIIGEESRQVRQVARAITAKSCRTQRPPANTRMPRSPEGSFRVVRSASGTPQERARHVQRQRLLKPVDGFTELAERFAATWTENRSRLKVTGISPPTIRRPGRFFPTVAGDDRDRCCKFRPEEEDRLMSAPAKRKIIQAIDDPHTFLWLLSADPSMSESMHDGLRDPTNEVYLSSVAVWKVIVKHPLGKLNLPSPPESSIPLPWRQPA